MATVIKSMSRSGEMEENAKIQDGGDKMPSILIFKVE